VVSSKYTLFSDIRKKIPKRIPGTKIIVWDFPLLNRLSLEAGLIPKKCPMCKELVEALEVHHWNFLWEDAVRLGLYRRMCSSCNQILGRLFKGEEPRYPWKWEDQWGELKSYLESSPSVYRHFDGREGSWGVVLRVEIREFPRLRLVRCGTIGERFMEILREGIKNGRIDRPAGWLE